MPKESVIVFVCEHGVAKSIIAATYFNELADEIGLEFRGIARGTNPDSELSPKAIAGLREDGLISTESIPQKLSLADVESAQQIITFCELPDEYQNKVVEQWDGIAPVSEDYEKARDVIIERLEALIMKLR